MADRTTNRQGDRMGTYIAMATTHTTRDDEPGINHQPHRTPLAGRLVWTSDVPRAVAQETEWDAAGAGWQAWQLYLKRRKQPVPALLRSPKQSPLGWCLPAEAGGPTGTEAFSFELLAALHRLSQGKRTPGFDVALEAGRWLPPGNGSIPERLRLNWAVESLAWAYTLPQLTEQLPPAAWWDLVQRLLDTAEAALTGLAPVDAGSPRASALTQQLVAGELPLVLAAVLPEIKPLRRLAKRGRKVIEDGFEQLLDGEGLPAAHLLPWFRPLAACWTRAAIISQELSGAKWGKTARDQYGYLVEHLLRMYRADGSSLLGEGAAGAPCPALLQAALLTADNSKAWRAAITLADRSLGLEGPLADAVPSRLSVYPVDESAGYNSEWSEFGLLRANWYRKAATAAVRYDGDHLQAELTAGQRTLLSGTWETQVTVNGQTLRPTSTWACVCWESDEEVDYLELEMSYGDDVRLQRQLLLARRDGFFLVADALLSLKPAQLEVVSRFPLAAGVQYEPAVESREAFLSDAKGKRRALVLPLALPEWRQSPAAGSLELQTAEAATGQLELRLQANGRSVFSPLFIDLQGSRLRNEEFTWRQLTVAQERQILPADEAAGYRVQVGDEQWLVYRSLATRGSRTVLGLNTTYEYVVGRVDTDECVVDPLLQVE